MMRLLALAGALTLCVAPATTAPLRPVAAGAAVALLVVLAGIVTLRRWLASTGAGLFVADYALALWLTDVTVDVIGSTVFGIALLLLLQSLEVARCRRGAVDVGVVRSQLTGWLVFGVAVPALVVLTLGLSHGIASSVPLLAAPLLAAAGAIGVLLGLAAALTRHSPEN
jgi:hypothetical protein